MAKTGWSPLPRCQPRIDRDRLIDSLDLRQIIRLEDQRDFGEYISGRCPHPCHDDRNPSFVVWKDRFRCMATGAHGPDKFEGTVIDWYCFHEEPSPDLSFGEILTNVAEFYGAGNVFVSSNSYVPKPIPVWTETLPEERINPTEIDILKGSKLEFFMWRYQLDRDTVGFERIGYSEQVKSFVIPVWDADHASVISFRFRRYDKAFPNGEYRIGSWSVPRYFGLRGHNAILLFNRWRLKYPRSDTIRVCFGEMTALFVDRVLGLDAVTVTNGAKAFKPYFVNLLRRVFDNVIILPDGGELIEAVTVGKLFGPMATLILPLRNEGDIIDWIRDGLLTVADYEDFEMLHKVPYNGIRRTSNAVKLWAT